MTRGSWKKSSDRGSCGGQKSTSGRHGTDTGSRTGWAIKIWRRGSSQEQPLRPASSYSSENSYTEEPYVNPEVQSAVYAELAPGLNTYSEIPDPDRLNAQRHCGSDLAAYENAGYALSETPTDPAATISPSSSAYYSDISEAHLYNYQKRKKKKDVHEVANPPFRDSFQTSSISATIPMMSGKNGPELFPTSGVRLHDLNLDRFGSSLTCNGPCHSCTGAAKNNYSPATSSPSAVILNSSSLNAIPLMSLNNGERKPLANVAGVRLLKENNKVLHQQFIPQQQSSAVTGVYCSSNSNNSNPQPPPLSSLACPSSEYI